jgi:putative Mn2+ efflux pump MntP
MPMHLLSQVPLMLGLGVGLAMDAVAVCVAAGLATATRQQGSLPKGAWRMAAVFGFCQFVMPLLGAGLGVIARQWIAAWGGPIAAVLLGIVALHLLWETWSAGDSEEPRAATETFGWGRLLTTGIATSLDAAAAGVSLSLMNLPIFITAALVGLITGGLCLAALHVGAAIGSRLGKRAEQAAGTLGALVLLAIAGKAALG